MHKRWIIIACLMVFTFVSAGSKPQRDPSQRTSSTSETKKAQKRELQILQQEFPRLADSALALKNIELKVETLARLADLLWSRDEAGARQLFQNTYDLLRAIEPAAADRPTAKSDDSISKLPRGKLIGLYIRFSSRLAKHDPAWKDQLLKDAPDFLTAPGTAWNLDLNTANLLLQEKDHRAFGFIEAANIHPAPGLADTLQVLGLLMRSRQLDARKADQLFLKLMRQLESQSSVTADDLLTIGNYLFSGRPVSGPEDKVLISPVYVGRTAFHADISYDRPGNSTEAIDGYLRSSVSVLSRPVDSESVMLQNRAAAFLLLPKARRFAPDLIPVLGNLSTGIDPTRTNSVEARAAEREPSGPLTLESVIGKLDSIRDPLKRDEHCLSMISQFYLSADFNSADALVNRMASSEIRGQLSSIVAIGRAVDSFRRDDLNSAQLLTRKLSSIKERSFLWFAIAARMIEKGDLQNGRMAMESGLVDARRTEGSVKASLLLLGSELTYRIDFAAGSNILSEALKVINAFDSEQDEPLRFDRFVRVKVGAQSATFSTDLSGFKSGTVSGAFKVPVSKDPNGTLTLILQLKNEYVRSSALVVFALELTAGKLERS